MTTKKNTPQKETAISAFRRYVVSRLDSGIPLTQMTHADFVKNSGISNLSQRSFKTYICLARRSLPEVLGSRELEAYGHLLDSHPTPKATLPLPGGKSKPLPPPVKVEAPSTRAVVVDQIVKLLTATPAMSYKKLCVAVGAPVTFAEIKEAKDRILYASKDKPAKQVNRTIFQTVAEAEAELDPVAYGALVQLVQGLASFTKLDLSIECVSLPQPRVKILLAPRG